MRALGKSKASVVLVMGRRDSALEGIRSQLDLLGVAVWSAANLQEFRRFMYESPAAVVISGVSLADGNWCDVLTSTVRIGPSAKVVVYSRAADERFWCEAIWRGVHDVLTEPVSSEDLRRLLDSDVWRGRRKSEDCTGKAAPSVSEESLPTAVAAAMV